MNDWLKKNGFGIDDILRSSLTVLLFFVLTFLAMWYWGRKFLPKEFFIGYGLGALYLLWVNGKNNTQDKSFSGDVNSPDLVNGGGGFIKGFTYQDVLNASN